MNKTQREFDNRDKFIELGYNIATTASTRA